MRRMSLRPTRAGAVVLCALLFFAACVALTAWQEPQPLQRGFIAGLMLCTFGRFFEEQLRIDPSHEIGPWRLNAWVSLVVFILATAFFVYWQFLRGRDRPRRRERAREAPKDAPAMSIPKGRVRPHR